MDTTAETSARANAANPADFAALIEQVQAAAGKRTPLAIRGGGTKSFYGEAATGMPLDVAHLRGIVAYEPTELVVTARCGTPLAELEQALARERQMLAFEPPHFGPNATVGGMVAAGLAGPRRANAGGIRDSVLGVTLLDGRGQVLRFGGTVMKNVAGYDIARTLAGSLGILGVLLEVTLKVVPRPAAETTLRFEIAESAALAQLNRWGGQPLPISASSWSGGMLQVRLAGAAVAVETGIGELGGEPLEADAAREHWEAIREQTTPFFAGNAPLWRVALPSIAPPLDLGGAQLVEWGGAQRWLRTDAPAARVRARAAELGGHATLFRNGDRTCGIFTPLAAPIAAIHRRLKDAFDPQRVLNPGRMYPDL
jgi:glycolate oxidase FAD binding subunit